MIKKTKNKKIAIPKTREKLLLEAFIEGNATAEEAGLLQKLNDKKMSQRERNFILGFQVKQGNLEARRIMIEENIGLVKSITLKLQSNGSGNEEDITSEAMIGLINAVDNYDPSLGNSFSTFARKRIFGALVEGIAKNGVSYTSKNIRKNIKYMNLYRDEYINEFGIEPTREEIAKKLEINLHSVVTAQLVENAMNHKNIGSILHEDSEYFIDIVDKTDSVETMVERKLENESLQQKLETLDELSKNIICFRYGFTTGEPMTEFETCQEFKIKRDKLTEIEAEALKILKDA